MPGSSVLVSASVSSAMVVLIAACHARSSKAFSAPATAVAAARRGSASVSETTPPRRALSPAPSSIALSVPDTARAARARAGLVGAHVTTAMEARLAISPALATSLATDTASAAAMGFVSAIATPPTGTGAAVPVIRAPMGTEDGCAMRAARKMPQVCPAAATVRVERTSHAHAFRRVSLAFGPVLDVTIVPQAISVPVVLGNVLVERATHVAETAFAHKAPVERAHAHASLTPPLGSGEVWTVNRVSSAIMDHGA
jgi:hypothetical protein